MSVAEQSRRAVLAAVLLLACQTPAETGDARPADAIGFPKFADPQLAALRERFLETKAQIDANPDGFFAISGPGLPCALPDEAKAFLAGDYGDTSEEQPAMRMVRTRPQFALLEGRCLADPVHPRYFADGRVRYATSVDSMLATHGKPLFTGHSVVFSYDLDGSRSWTALVRELGEGWEETIMWSGSQESHYSTSKDGETHGEMIRYATGEGRERRLCFRHGELVKTTPCDVERPPASIY